MTLQEMIEHINQLHPICFGKDLARGQEIKHTIMQMILVLQSENEQLKAQLATAIAPPYKKGQTCYWVCRSSKFIKQIMIEDRYLDIGDPFEWFYNNSSYRHSNVFATREEAEASLNQKEGK